MGLSIAVRSFSILGATDEEFAPMFDRDQLAHAALAVVHAVAAAILAFESAFGDSLCALAAAAIYAAMCKRPPDRHAP